MMKLSSLWILLVTGMGVVGLTLLARSAASAGSPGGMAAAGCNDLDGDGYGIGCAAGNDCNDRDPAIHPGAIEICNFKDDNCNGLVDEAPDCVAPALDPTPVHMPAGSFLMGSETGAADEKPVHRVTGSDFVLDRYEVTNARYQACVRAGACAAPSLQRTVAHANTAALSQCIRHPAWHHTLHGEEDYAALV